MEWAKFTSMVHDPARTREELVQILRNVLQKEEAGYALSVKEQLDLRFPDWQKPRSRRGGNTPTVVMYRKQVRHFGTATDAFLWLVEQLIQAHPNIFDELETTKRLSIKGSARQWFAKSPEELYYFSSHLADTSAHYRKLSNGWYADVNSSNEQKRNVLVKLFYEVEGKDSDWVFLPAPP